MIYLEMSRNKEHGGGTWAFGNCLWAPIRKKGGGKWRFWTKVHEIRKGDLILHLRGITPQANFVGYSIAASDGFQTDRRPPNPGKWNFAEAFYRADLTDFIPFHQPINLTDIFSLRKVELNLYFDANKSRRAKKTNIFFVRQSARLQCLNGAYLSEVNEGLLTALFGAAKEPVRSSTKSSTISIDTGIQISTIFSRLGQARFASEIKELYGNTCCFPGCNISDTRFLVASHIARWSDNEHLRGHMGNGLCLCLLHDKAFEIGLFTLDALYKIYVNPRDRRFDSEIVKELVSHHGECIRLSDVKPMDDALLEHWSRVNIEFE
jgi:putative restriction endonuclease